MFGNSSETEMNIDVDTTIKTKPPIEREEKLRKVEEKLLSKRTNERFTNYDDVISDDNLSLPQKIIHLQKATGDATRRKIFYALLQGELLEKCFHQSKRVYEEILVETKITNSGCNFYKNYTNLLWTTINLNTTLFL